MLPDDLYRTVLDRLDDVLDLSTEAERRAFVASQTDLTDEARAELAALLATTTVADRRFEQPAQALLGEALPNTGQRYETFGDDAGPLSGHTLGVWRLGKRLGAGGMAVVYEAFRDDGLYDQKAAAKVMRLDLFGDDLAARFDRERRLLALLDHDGLTRLLDGGTTPDGRPFFVMEFVDGRPLTDALAEASLEARLDAFVRACDAVAHAHRALVVHRDLKPSHLVRTPDGRVKVLDFGIARLLGEAAEGDLTRPDGAPHTRAYAAPEQLAGQPATTATDVYALGLVLYELLTGRRAFGPDRAAQEDTPCPSDAPGLDARLRKALRGDLDAIVGRATTLAPVERYGSVDALADDLRRHLSHLPVRARRGTFGYRARRFVRRRRVELAAVAALVAVGGGVGAVAWQRHAEAQRATAQAARSAAYLSGLFDATSPYAEDSLAATSTTTMGDFLALSARRARRDLAGDPALLADVLARVGKGLYDFERFDEAERILRDVMALHVRQQTMETAEAFNAQHQLVKTLASAERFDDADREAAQFLVRVRALPEDTLRVRMLIKASGEIRDPVRSRAVLDEARRLLESLAIDPTALHEELTLAEIRFANAAGDTERAADLHAESYRLVRERRGDGHALTAVALTNYGMALSAAGRTAEALDAYDRALPVLEAQGGESDNVLGLLNARANALSALERHDEAIAQHRDVLARRIRRYGARHSSVAVSYQNLGVSLAKVERFAEAADACGRAAALYADLVPADDPTRYYPLITLARLERLAGRPVDAEATARRALAGLDPLLPEAHPAPVTARLYLGLALAAQGKRAQARPVLLEARAALLALAPPDSAGAAEADDALR